jgi:ABC-2 type transport system permease protein
MSAALADLSAPSMVRLFAAESRAELLRLVRTPSFAVPTLAFPLVFYVFFGLVLPGEAGRLARATYMLATYGVFGVMGPALFGFGAGLAIERQQGWLELKRVSPMPPAAYFFAKVTASLAFALAGVLLLSAAALAGGVRVELGPWLALVGVLLMGTLPFCALGLWVGSVVRGQAAPAVINLIHLPMAVLSGLWIPLSVFPPVMAKLAPLWPAWHLSQLALSAVGKAEHVPVLSHVAVLLAMTSGFLALAALRLRAQ